MEIKYWYNRLDSLVLALSVGGPGFNLCKRPRYTKDVKKGTSGFIV